MANVRQHKGAMTMENGNNTAEIVSRANMLDSIAINSIANSVTFLADFESSINILDTDELKETRRRLTQSTVSNRVKLNLHTWQLGQTLTKKSYDALCDKYASVKDSEFELVEDSEKVDKNGKPVVKYRNPVGLTLVTANSEETILKMLEIANIDKSLQTAYAKATHERKDAQTGYAAAIESGTDASVGKAQRKIIATTTALAAIKRKISTETTAIPDGKKFAESLLKGVISMTKSKKHDRQSKIKIMGVQTSLIAKRIEFLTANDHTKTAQSVGSEYKFAVGLSTIPEIEE